MYMQLDKIIIKNFKSIQELELDVKKHGNSYTTMFLGINEAGKSNILQAISFLKTPKEEFSYSLLHNQKDEENKEIDLYFHFSFKSKYLCLTGVRGFIKNGELLDFEITDILKNVFLSKARTIFLETYTFNVKKLTKNLYIKKIPQIPQSSSKYTFEISKKNDPENTFEALTEEFVEEHFREIIIERIKIYEPNVSFWKPSKQYLISSVDLNEFKKNIYSNIPLKNIFILSGYKTSEEIKEKIKEISNMQLRKKLMRILSSKTTKYVKSIWKHNINIDIEITDSGICNVSIKDEGEKNEDNYFDMNDRSEGFKQFMSLILSLSVETKKLVRKKKLILIDEPETHLHPSGIRDLGKELLEIGKNNYLFVSTHSPFLIDRDSKERNIIIQKDAFSLTVKKEITNESDIKDDEVLSEAFGINVYRDLLNPHKILVEGGSDKLVLEKAFSLKGFDYGITNGTGSNIVQVASKLNHDEIKVMVIVDDDKEGKKYRDEIIKISGVFSTDNVFTLRDLVGVMTNEGTIEDLLGKNFIENKFKEFYKDEFSEECSLNFNHTPFIEQIKRYLQQKQLEKKKLKETLDKFKKKVSDEFNPSKSNFGTKFPRLKELVDKIDESMNR